MIIGARKLDIDDTVFTVTPVNSGFDYYQISGRAGVIKQVEVDLGSALNQTQATVRISDISVTATSHIIAQIAYEAPTGKDIDEIEMDQILVIAGQQVPGSFILQITSLTGDLHDKFKINYIVY